MTIAPTASATPAINPERDAKESSGSAGIVWVELR